LSIQVPVCAVGHHRSLLLRKAPAGNISTTKRLEARATRASGRKRARPRHLAYDCNRTVPADGALLSGSRLPLHLGLALSACSLRRAVVPFRRAVNLTSNAVEEPPAAIFFRA